MRFDPRWIPVALLAGAMAHAQKAPPSTATQPRRGVHLVVMPSTVALGDVEAGDSRQVTFTLRNEGTAEAQGVTCKARHFTFAQRKVAVAGGASRTITGTYQAPPTAPRQDTPIKETITCGTARVAVTGTLKGQATEGKAGLEPSGTGTSGLQRQPVKGMDPPAPAGGGVPAKDAPANIVISECQAKQPPVPFPHKAHYDEKLNIACDTCHHTLKGLKAGSATKVPKCSSCHLNPAAGSKAPSCQQMSLKTNPFHVLCIGCHKQRGGAAPTKCSGCHKK